MSAFDYSDSPYPVREDLQAAHRQAWLELARPGNWWTGEERVAIARESRDATSCAFCRERKQALSPYALAGEHEHSGILNDLTVDAVHRVVTDQSRITRAYVEANTAAGLSEERYVELVGIVVQVFSVDEFNRGIGVALEPLPQAQPGAPDNYRPTQATHGTGFVAMIPADGSTGREADLWPINQTANVLRALSLVPDAVRAWLALSDAQYLSMNSMATELGAVTGRSIDRMQIELVAGRVSAVNECFY